MSVLFICPTNPRFMPYLDNYLELIFRRGDKRHQRGVFDYYMFGRFVAYILEGREFDKIVCFGLQTAFFVRKFLLGKYAGKFILDVRDHNIIARFYNFSSIVSRSSYAVVSSLGYLSWLPSSEKYLLNHNAKFKDLSLCAKVLAYNSDEKIKISSIGALRDLKININFIRSISSNELFYLNYHGKGDVNTQLENSVLGVDFVKLTGFYQKEQEGELYILSDMINVLRYPDGINMMFQLGF